MNKAMPSYEERLKNPHLEIINFNYLLTHPEFKAEIWNNYCFNISFRTNVNEKIKNNPSFKKRFFDCFRIFINSYNQKQMDYRKK